jgi:hypothetical protein
MAAEVDVKTTENKLLRKQCVLHDNGTCHDVRDGLMRWFVNPDYNEPRQDGEIPGSKVEIPLQVWEDFGKPRIITVTIEPGDLLNDEG